MDLSLCVYNFAIIIINVMIIILLFMLLFSVYVESRVVYRDINIWELRNSSTHVVIIRNDATLSLSLALKFNELFINLRNCIVCHVLWHCVTLIRKFLPRKVHQHCTHNFDEIWQYNIESHQLIKSYTHVCVCIMLSDTSVRAWLIVRKFH